MRVVEMDFLVELIYGVIPNNVFSLAAVSIFYFIVIVCGVYKIRAEQKRILLYWAFTVKNLLDINAKFDKMLVDIESLKEKKSETKNR